VGSVKQPFSSLFEQLSGDNIEFLSTHPMAGKETWGFSQSEENLFQDCSWIICPHQNNRPQTLEQFSALIEIFGAQPIFLSAQKHDEQVALISHLPALISRLLLRFVETQCPEALAIAGPGFKSMTRLARDNPRLQKEMVQFNQAQLDQQFYRWLGFVKEKKQ
jgi:prephenate dehydrogenase